MAEKADGKTISVADGECPMCGTAVVVKRTKTGNLCYTCPCPADGGCGHQTFGRYAASNAWIAANVCRSWRDQKWRAEFGGSAEPAPAPDPLPTPAPAVDPPPPPPAPKPKKTKAEPAPAKSPMQSLDDELGI